MSTPEEERDPDAATEAEAVAGEVDESGVLTIGELGKRKLDLDVQIEDAGPCKKHVKVVVPQEEVERQFNESLGELRRDAQVPGFRPGRAPSSLVRRRFRKEVAGQVKTALLMACMEQLDDEHKLNPITQPDFDIDAIELPEDGPLSFEMDVEVQPEFDLPAYKALTANRPTKEISEADVDAQLKSFLERYAQVVPKFEGAAEPGDLVTADLTFHKDGVTFNEAKELQFRLLPELRFQDGHVPDLAGALVGANPGETRETDAQVGSSSQDPSLRGQTIRVTFHVHDLKQLRLPEVNAEFLRSIGFESEEELREALRGVLERRFEFQQRQSIRQQIVDQLIQEVPFDLPADLVARQERSTLQRQVEEMRQAGLSDAEIRAREAEIRANAHEQTQRSLKEFFLLSKIAEAEEIEVEETDFDLEVAAIASRTDESPRRIRSRIEKEGLAEGLAQQILERKTLDRILEYVKLVDVPMTEEKAVETLDQVASPATESEEQSAEAESSSESS